MSTCTKNSIGEPLTPTKTDESSSVWLLEGTFNEPEETRLFVARCLYESESGDSVRFLVNDAGSASELLSRYAERVRFLLRSVSDSS
jgi:hypothetical protein